MFTGKWVTAVIAQTEERRWQGACIGVLHVGLSCNEVCQAQDVLGTSHLPMSAELGGSALTLYAVPANLETRKAVGVSEILQTERASCSARPISGSLDGVAADGAGTVQLLGGIYLGPRRGSSQLL